MSQGARDSRHRGPTVTRVLVHAIHVGAWAICYGAITYTYFRLNKQMRALAATHAEYEEFAAVTAPGLHRWIAGSLAVAAVTGIALVVAPAAEPRGSSWWMLVAAKTAVLVALCGLEVGMRLVMWPRRLQAPPVGSIDEGRRFHRLTFAMGFFLLVQLVLGTLAVAV